MLWVLKTHPKTKKWFSTPPFWFSTPPVRCWNPFLGCWKPFWNQKMVSNTPCLVFNTCRSSESPPPFLIFVFFSAPVFHPNGIQHPPKLSRMFFNTTENNYVLPCFPPVLEFTAASQNSTPKICQTAVCQYLLWKIKSVVITQIDWQSQKSTNFASKPLKFIASQVRRAIL